MPRWIEAIQAEQEYGTTIPVVPRIDRPPTMPSRALSVLSASAAPPRNGDLDLGIGRATALGGDLRNGGAHHLRAAPD